jgi:hypothetical protein
MAKTYTSVPTVSTLATYPSATYNTYTAQNINNLIVPPMCRLEKSAGASITSGSVFTWNVESFDTDDMHSTSSNTERITINTAGVYLVTFTYTLNFSGTITKEQPQILLSGSAYQYDMKYGSAAGNTANTVQTVIACNATDYLRVLIDFTGGSSFTVDGNTASTSFSAVWVGRTS